MKWKHITIEVSEAGDIKFLGKLRATRQDSRGYASVAFTVHRFVAAAFRGDPPDGLVPSKMVVDHIDGDKTNCHESNLRWVTQRQNVNNKTTRGVGVSKLTEDQVKEIQKQHPNNYETLKQVAKRFGVSVAATSQIRSRTSYGEFKNHPRRRLTDEQIEFIRAWRKPPHTTAQLAAKFGVSRGAIWYAWHKRKP